MQQSRIKGPKQSGTEKGYLNTTIPVNLIRSLRVMAAQRESRINDVLTEAIRDLLKKYETLKRKS